MATGEQLDDLAQLFLPDVLQLGSLPVPPSQADELDIMDIEFNPPDIPQSLMMLLFNKLMAPFAPLPQNEEINHDQNHFNSHNHHAGFNHYAGFVPVLAMGQNQQAMNNRYPHMQFQQQPYYSEHQPPFAGVYNQQVNNWPQIPVPPPEPLLLAETVAETPKRKHRRKEPVELAYVFDYRTHHLRPLLDLKPQPPARTDYTIIDKDNNPVEVTFGGFLNGRFLTNDIDNSNYFISKNNKTELSQSLAMAPAVISCYRRNYIQISMNMNILGIRSLSPLLRLQTLEYGYTITRVIKYFKLEVLAEAKVPHTNKNVTIKIRNLVKETEKEKRAQLSVLSPQDTVVPAQILSAEHIILLNDDQPVVDGTLDKYFVIKQCQFKSATPNNGNLTFQNYYHLIVRLLAVVADLYHDDYYEEDPSLGGAGALGPGSGETNEILLSELKLEPIIVRGRNPSFYADRKDMLIRGRLSLSKRSYKFATSGTSISADENEEIEELDSGNEDGEEAPPPPPPPQPQLGTAPLNSALALLDDLNQQNPQTAGQNANDIELPKEQRYKYFPILNVYYLPPINVVYFPHLHPSKEELVVPEAAGDSLKSRERRKSLNIYFS